MKKIVIIGGGITGCISAIYCVELGYEVEIYEKKNSLGGIVNDIIEKKIFSLMGPNIIMSTVGG